jgi:hypothetical protein
MNKLVRNATLFAAVTATIVPGLRGQNVNQPAINAKPVTTQQQVKVREVETYRATYNGSNVECGVDTYLSSSGEVVKGGPLKDTECMRVTKDEWVFYKMIGSNLTDVVHGNTEKDGVQVSSHIVQTKDCVEDMPEGQICGNTKNARSDQDGADETVSAVVKPNNKAMVERTYEGKYNGHKAVCTVKSYEDKTKRNEYEQKRGDWDTSCIATAAKGKGVIYDLKGGKLVGINHFVELQDSSGLHSIDSYHIVQAADCGKGLKINQICSTTKSAVGWQNEAEEIERVLRVKRG